MCSQSGRGVAPTVNLWPSRVSITQRWRRCGGRNRSRPLRSGAIEVLDRYRSVRPATRGGSTSVADLMTKIRTFINGCNGRKHPFIWTKPRRPDHRQINPKRKHVSTTSLGRPGADRGRATQRVVVLRSERPRPPYDDDVDVRRAAVSAGQEALQAGRWAEAREALRRDVEREPAPEALFGLGVAEWWLGRVEESLRLWEQAFVGYRRSGEPHMAVVTAVYLCLSYRMSLGNDLVAQGWSRRAASLVEEHGLEEVAGWVHLCRAFMANDSGSPARRQGGRWRRRLWLGGTTTPTLSSAR